MRVTVVTPGQNRISINNQARKAIRVGGLSTGSIDSLDDLTDVVTANVTNNNTLVYNANTGKFEAKDLSIVIDGGTF